MLPPVNGSFRGSDLLNLVSEQQPGEERVKVVERPKSRSVGGGSAAGDVCREGRRAVRLRLAEVVLPHGRCAGGRCGRAAFMNRRSLGCLGWRIRPSSAARTEDLPRPPGRYDPLPPGFHAGHVEKSGLIVLPICPRRMCVAMAMCRSISVTFRKASAHWRRSLLKPAAMARRELRTDIRYDISTCDQVGFDQEG